MRKMAFKTRIFIVLAQLFLSSTIQAKLYNFDQNSEMIYGKDDRYEIADYPYSKFVFMARSVAIRISNRRLSEDRLDQSKIDFPFIKLKNAMPLICPTERFIEQYSLGDCSGFLVAPNILATAGHCMRNMSECSANKWIFDFRAETTQFSKNNVYSCKNIIAQKNIYDQNEISDYALIELDREVKDRLPLTLRKFGRVHINTPLVVIGHPLGLPMKITEGAKVSYMNDSEREDLFQSFLLRAHYFTANIDSYAGNSGSPVINKKTGKVEGILIQGASDFVFNDATQCLESNHLSNSYHNTYEKVMRITKIPSFQ